MKIKKPNKSELIRQHLKTATDLSPAAVSKSLNSKGLKVSPGLVSVVKSVLKNGRKTKTNTSSLSRHLKILSKARKFILDAGGPTQAKELIDIVRRIVS